ncbi:MAG: ABC transporter permease [Clostridiales bacterium]|jgi:ABC-2 type transport system permease protein|nr:ABC transporter permease [Clostridiales bacterium]
MKVYLSVFKIRFSAVIQYRAAALAGIATQFAWGFLEIFAFRTIYSGNESGFPMPFSQLSSYIWLQQAFLALFMTWFYDRDILDAISSGNISYELSRPLDLYGRWFFQTAANRVARALLRCAPILVVAFFLPGPFRLSLPENGVQALGFLVSLALGLGVVVAFGMLIYTLTFYTLSSTGLWAVFAMLADFMSGSVIPLPFFPSGIRKIAELLPFASMQNLPLRIYVGNIAGSDMLIGLVLQCFWLLSLVIFGRLIMRRALTKVTVHGG